MTDSPDQPPLSNQSSLFTSAPDTGDVPAYELAVLALAEIKGLSLRGIYVLAQNLGEHLGQLFTWPSERVLEQLQTVRVHNASVIAQEITGVNHQFYLEAAQQRLLQLQRNDVQLLGYAKLPASLRQSNGPCWLFVQGNAQVLHRPNIIGVVGTREPSQDGLLNTRRVARVLSGYDVCVVSGLAEGIDDEVHRSSMDQGLANIAFLGHGINRVFPASTAYTRERILKSGGVVATEYFPDDMYQKSYFVQRNRLQALLARAVIFVEAAAQSGTAHTYHFSVEYRRKVIGIKQVTPGLDSVIAEAGNQVIDLSDAHGMRELDKQLRIIAGKAGQTPKSLERLLKHMEIEMSIRSFSRGEVQRFFSEAISRAETVLRSNRDA